MQRVYEFSASAVWYMYVLRGVPAASSYYNSSDKRPACTITQPRMYSAAEVWRFGATL